MIAYWHYSYVWYIMKSPQPTTECLYLDTSTMNYQQDKRGNLLAHIPIKSCDKIKKNFAKPVSMLNFSTLQGEDVKLHKSLPRYCYYRMKYTFAIMPIFQKVNSYQSDNYMIN